MPQLKMRIKNEIPASIITLPPLFPYSVGDIIHLPNDREHAYKVEGRHIYPDMGAPSIVMTTDDLDDTLIVLDVVKGRMKQVEVKVKDEE